MSLTVTKLCYDHASKNGELWALFDEDLFENSAIEEGMNPSARHHIPDVAQLFTLIDPSVKYVDWFDFMAELTCRYRPKQDGTWEVGPICRYETTQRGWIAHANGGDDEAFANFYTLTPPGPTSRRGKGSRPATAVRG